MCVSVQSIDCRYDSAFSQPARGISMNVRTVCSRTKIAMVPRAFRRASFFPLTTIVWALCLRETVDAIEGFCPDEASVNLTDATQNSTGFISKTGQFFPTDIVRHEEGERRGCICDVKPCVSLCLPLRDANGTILGIEHFRNVSAEIPRVHTTNLTPENLGDDPPNSEEWFYVFYFDPCMGGPAYYLEPKTHEIDEWYLLKNGTLFLPHNNRDTFKGWSQYCFRQKRNDTIYTPRVCSPEPQMDPFRTANYIGGLVSVPFLVVTIFVYSVLPELRNIHGNTFRCYLCCLLATYITLAADRIPPPADNIGTLCLILGFSIYFSFLSSFLWLNVMCFDMWWRFGGYGSLQHGGKLHDRKRFIGYSIYTWGTAIILTAICIGLEFSPGLPKFMITPGFRRRSCWFDTKTAAALYFLGPVGVTIICNICLFVLTSIKLVQHKRNTEQQLSSGDSQRHDDNKLLFSLYLKLFVIMGINWSTEVISGLWDNPKYVWYFTDMVNALQGILIFIIFICKKNILHSLEKRFKCFPRLSRNGCTSTQRSTDSRTTTSSLDNSTSRPDSSVGLNARINTSPDIRNSPKLPGKPQ